MDHKLNRRESMLMAAVLGLLLACVALAADRIAPRPELFKTWHEFGRQDTPNVGGDVVMLVDHRDCVAPNGAAFDNRADGERVIPCEVRMAHRFGKTP